MEKQMKKEDDVEKDAKEDVNKKASKDKSDKLIELKESEYQKLKDEAAENKDKYIRLYAEFENTRKRMDREKIEFVKYANEDLISEFLNVLEDFERVLAAVGSDKDKEELGKGVSMVMNRIYEMLKRNGVTVIEAVGKPFDPHMHEILMQEETDEHEDSVVLEELQKGYMFHDKVIRTVKVKIAKNTEQTKQEK